MKYALVKDNKVENVIVAEADYISTIEQEFQHVEVIDTLIEQNLNIAPGWGWTQQDGFIRPPDPEPVIEPKKITRLAFLNRFTDAEAIALDLASIGTTVEAASIRRYMQKVNAATFIDLTREDTIDGVGQLESVGLIGTGRADQILGAPIAEQERVR